MNSQSTTRTKALPVLVAVIAMALVLVGWATDRYFLNAKIQEFNFSIGKQSVSEYYGPLEKSYYESKTERIETRVTNQDLAACPTWKPSDGNPPISARKAIALADEVAASLRPYKDSNWEFQHLALSQLDTGETENGGHWCWQAYYRGHSVHQARSREIWVLFDGSVITPKVVQK